MLPYFVFDQFNLGPIKLYTWGLFVGLGFSAGYLLLLYLAKKKDLAPEKMAGLALAIFLGGVLGAKALPVALLPGGFFNNIDLLFSQHSGAMFMGGLVGAIICASLYIRLVNLDFWMIADLLVLPTALGIAIGRIGCVLINDHQGAATNLPWGILWPDGIIRHPVGVYESLTGLLLFLVFWWIKKYEAQKIPPNLPFSKGGALSFRKGWRGSIFEVDGFFSLLFLASYSVIRFFLEFTRVASGPLADPRRSALTVSQWLALLILGFVVVFLLRKRTGKFV